MNHPDHVVSFTSHTLDTMLRRHGWEPVEHAVFVYEVKTRADGTRAAERSRAAHASSWASNDCSRGSAGRTSRAAWSSSLAPSPHARDEAVRADPAASVADSEEGVTALAHRGHS